MDCVVDGVCGRSLVVMESVVSEVGGMERCLEVRGSGLGVDCVVN